MKKVSSFFLLMVVLLSSCKKDEFDQNNNNNNYNNNNQNQVVAPKFLTIVDAQTLFISSKGSKKKGSTADNVLYKITPTGMVIEVVYLDEQGDTITQQQNPYQIYNLSSDYILMTFMTNQGHTRYLVRKSDGAVFSSLDLPRPADMNNNNTFQPAQQDKDGNIYYMAYTNDNSGMSNVIKLDVSNPSNIVVSRYSAAGDNVWSFSLLNGGNLFYNQRIRFPETGFITNPYDSYLCSDLTNDSMFVVAKTQTPNGWTVRFNKLGGSSLVGVPYGDSLNVYQVEYAYGLRQVVKFPKISKLIALYGGVLVELENSTRQPVMYSLSHFGLTVYRHVEQLFASDNYYYLLGWDALVNGLPNQFVKVNPIDHTSQEIPLPSGYEIYKATVTPDDVIQLYALRLSDGNRVLAELNPTTGEVKVLRVLDDAVITSMERIN